MADTDSSLTSTQVKLRTTPTAGVASEHSPYYRRLLSAGYKGFLQGTIGGATLYGALGLGVGALVAVPAFFMLGAAGVAAAPAFLLIPFMGGLGIMKGASTFGNIGSVAAISAESAEMSEKRRYLLDRYNDLPDTPEFDDEANRLQELLNRQHDSKAPESAFHWKTVALGAALGAAVAFGLMFLPFSHFIIAPVIAQIGVAATSAVGVAIGTMLGAAAGATIGLDRFYVRKWFDFSEGVLHDQSKIEKDLATRQQEVDFLAGRKPPISTQISADQAMGAPAAVLAEAERPMAITPEQIAGIAPTNQTTSGRQLVSRLAEIQQAMANPVL